MNTKYFICSDSEKKTFIKKTFDNYVPFSFTREESKDKIPPICNACGERLRKENYLTRSWGETRNLPWNSDWNGKCENCDFDYNLEFTQVFDSDDPESTCRITRIKIKNREICSGFFDANSVLSGIEIETTTEKERQFRYAKTIGKSESGNVEKIFLSTNDLKVILSYLANSPFLEQFDWGDSAD